MRNKTSYSEAGKLGYLASKESQEKNKKLRIDNYNNSPTLCNCCSAALPYEKRQNKFCNHACSAKVSNNNRIRKIKSISPHVEIIQKQMGSRMIQIAVGTCKFCKKTFEFSGKVKIRKYCTSYCKSQETKNRVQLEISNGKVWGHSSFTLRQYLKDTRGNKCQICGISEWQGKPLVVIMDHIDGNSTNNNLDNLRLVCSNCDANLPTYKSKNKGNGRFKRQQRYEKGLSF